MNCIDMNCISLRAELYTFGLVLSLLTAVSAGMPQARAQEARLIAPDPIVPGELLMSATSDSTDFHVRLPGLRNFEVGEKSAVDAILDLQFGLLTDASHKMPGGAPVVPVGRFIR
jgi:hypothetical protein